MHIPGFGGQDTRNAVLDSTEYRCRAQAASDRKYDGVSEISLSFATHLCMLILLGIRGAILIAVITTLLLKSCQKPYYKAFSIQSQYSLTLLISGSLFYWLKLSPENITLDLVMDMPALLPGLVPLPPMFSS